MKLHPIFTALAVFALTSCSSYDNELPVSLEEPSTAIGDVLQITEDVNSAEVNNTYRGSAYRKESIDYV